jgi:hypothetical protein
MVVHTDKNNVRNALSDLRPDAIVLFGGSLHTGSLMI